MSRVVLEIAIALSGFGVTLIMGYRAWRFQKRVRQQVPDAMRHGSPAAAMPIAAGLAVGMLLLCIAMQHIALGDRFYGVVSGVRITLAILIGALLVVSSEMLMYVVALTRAYPWTDKGKIEETTARLARRRWIVKLVAELVASVLVVAGGVRFSVLGLGGGREVMLGAWGIPLTIFWLLVATNVVKLFEGLQGASNMVVLMAAVAICYATVGHQEFVLQAIALLIGAVMLASLRFNLHPARLQIGGAGTSFLGFLFAVLTVLSRQKTLATFLVVLPLLLVLVVIGGTMLSRLERNMSFGSGDDEE